MKKPKRKFVLIEVETSWTNRQLREHAFDMFEDQNCKPVQVHVNAAMKVAKK